MVSVPRVAAFHRTEYCPNLWSPSLVRALMTTVDVGRSFMIDRMLSARAPRYFTLLVRSSRELLVDAGRPEITLPIHHLLHPLVVIPRTRTTASLFHVKQGTT